MNAKQADQADHELYQQLRTKYASGLPAVCTYLCNLLVISISIYMSGTATHTGRLNDYYFTTATANARKYSTLPKLQG